MPMESLGLQSVQTTNVIVPPSNFLESNVLVDPSIRDIFEFGDKNKGRNNGTNRISTGHSRGKAPKKVGKNLRKG